MPRLVLGQVQDLEEGAGVLFGHDDLQGWGGVPVPGFKPSARSFLSIIYLLDAHVQESGRGKNALLF